MSGEHDQWKKPLATAFGALLQRDQALRVSWLSCQRSQTRYTGFVIPIAPEDEPLLNDLERRLPDNPGIRLNAFLSKLRFRARDVFELAPEPLLYLWLMDAILRYQIGKYPDPLKPRGRRGHRWPVFRTPENWLAVTVPLIRKLDRPGDPVTRSRLAPYLRSYLPQRSAKHLQRADESVEKFISRQCKRFCGSWEALVQDVRSAPSKK